MLSDHELRRDVALANRIVHAAGLVTSRRSGREVLFSVSSARLAATARWMADLAAAWDRRLDHLKTLAESPVAED